MPEDSKPVVTEALRAAIIAGEYAPKQRLVEIDLCERFGTSRFILRSALQELAAQGLVEFQRNRGARVREISLTEAIEITEVRILLEGLLAARAAERVSKSDIAMLRKLTKDMRIAVDKSELLTYSELNARLHAAIRDIGAHETASRLPRPARPVLRFRLRPSHHVHLRRLRAPPASARQPGMGPSLAASGVSAHHLGRGGLIANRPGYAHPVTVTHWLTPPGPRNLGNTLPT